jgi:hypothetical protein
MMADVNDDQDLGPAAKRARLRATRRARKRDPGRMRVSGKGAFLLQRLMAERAGRARQRLARRPDPGE